MNRAPENTGAVTLTLGQLEERLQLAMAARAQLQERQQVYRSFVQTSMEAYGLELPPHMPLNSFTSHPSQTNYPEVTTLVDQHIDGLTQARQVEYKQRCQPLCEEIAAFNVKAHNVHQMPSVAHLQVALSYMEGLDLEALRASQEPLVVSELARLDHELQWWVQECKELGLMVLDAHGELYSALDQVYAHPTSEQLHSCTEKIGVWKYAESPLPMNLHNLTAFLQVIPTEGLPVLYRELPCPEDDLSALQAIQLFIQRVEDVDSIREGVLDCVRRIMQCLGTLRSLQA